MLVGAELFDECGDKVDEGMTVQVSGVGSLTNKIIEETEYEATKHG